MSATAQTLVIGLGNDFRRDDGAGRIAARRIKAEAGEGLARDEENGEGTALMDAWRGAELVILIDAVHSGAPRARSIVWTRAHSESRLASARPDERRRNRPGQICADARANLQESPR